MRNYEVTPEAVKDAKFIGIGGDVTARLKRMARRAARLTHAEFNWRFDSFGLLIEGQEIRGIGRLN